MLESMLQDESVLQNKSVSQSEKIAILADASNTITYGETPIKESTANEIIKTIKKGVYFCVITGCSESIVDVILNPLENIGLKDLGPDVEIPVYIEHGTRAIGRVNGYQREPNEIIAFKRGNGHDDANRELKDLLLRSQHIKRELCDFVECEDPSRVYQDNSEIECDDIREQLKVTYSMSFRALSESFSDAAEEHGIDFEPPLEEWGDPSKFNPSYWRIFVESIKKQTPDSFKEIISLAEKKSKKKSEEFASVVRETVDRLGYNDTHKVESYTTSVDVLPIILTKGTAAVYELHNKWGSLDGARVVVMGDSVSDLEMVSSLGEYNVEVSMLIPKGSTLDKQGYGERENFYVVEGGIGAPMFEAAQNILFPGKVINEESLINSYG